MELSKEELIIWLNTVLRNKKGIIDSNKVRSLKYKEYIDGLKSLIKGNYTFLQRIWLIDRNLTEPLKCSCGKEVIWVQGHREYSKYCSADCAKRDPEVIQKRKDTNLLKYGCVAPLQNKEIQSKVQKTNLERYGAKSSFERKDFREKSIKTMMKNYGVDNPQKNKDIREKTNKTNMERYGSSSPLHGNTAYKSKKTMIEKYGVEFAFQNKELFEKFKNTMIQVYGTEHALQNKEIINKEIEKRFKKLYEKILSGERTDSKVIPLFTYNNYKGTEYTYTWKCVECGNEFEYHLQDGRIPRCIKCYPLMTSVSSSEIEIKSYLEQWGIKNIISSDRSIIPPLELDIYLPDKKLAIEFNGLYWHSEIAGRKNKNYHLNKLNLCADKGIELIQIFEDEWIQKKNIVLALLKSKLGIITNKYHARKLKIKIVDSNIERVFLDSYHIQGYYPSFIVLGLYNKEELISLASFIKARYRRNSEWELLRYVTKADCQVIGGLSKLLSYFRKRYIGSIVSYCDKRLFNGKGYEAVGFTKLKDSLPNYYYTKNYTNRSSRVQFQKHKLKKKLESFDFTLTEWENMQINGYDRIWDCGNMVYELIP